MPLDLPGRSIPLLTGWTARRQSDNPAFVRHGGQKAGSRFGQGTKGFGFLLEQCRGWHRAAHRRLGHRSHTRLIGRVRGVVPHPELLQRSLGDGRHHAGILGGRAAQGHLSQ